MGAVGRGGQCTQCLAWRVVRAGRPVAVLTLADVPDGGHQQPDEAGTQREQASEHQDRRTALIPSLTAPASASASAR